MPSSPAKDVDHHALLLQGAPAPSSEDLASGNFTLAAAHGTVDVLAAGQPVRVVMQGLTPLTPYEAYFVGRDNATIPNTMAQVWPDSRVALHGKQPGLSAV